MSEWEKIVCTSALTISGGLLVFCVGQIIQRFVLEPIQELKKTIAEIRFRLNYYADVHPSEFETAPAVLKERIATASEAFRESAIRLETYAAIIPLYDLCELVFRLPKCADIHTIVGHLIFISNTFFETHPEERKERRRQIGEVKQLLRLPS